MFKWGRDSSGNWKQISVIKSFCCLSSSDKGYTFQSWEMVLLRKEMSVLKMHQDQDITVKIKRRRCSPKIPEFGASREETYNVLKFI